MFNYTLYCQNPACGIEFESKRPDKKFHDNACKMAYHRAQKKIKEEEQAKFDEWADPIHTEIKDLEFSNSLWDTLIGERQKVKMGGFILLNALKAEMEELKTTVARLEWVQTLKIDFLYNRFINPAIKKLREGLAPGSPVRNSIIQRYQGASPDTIINMFCVHNIIPDEPEYDDVQILLKVFRDNWKENKQKLNGLERKVNYHQTILNDKTTLPSWQKMVAQNNAKIKELKEKLANPPKFEKPKRKIIIRRPKHLKKKNPRHGEMRPGDLRGMHFETFQLPGELGRFMGNLERHKLAFALTGDSGAGKSTFSYLMVKRFLDAGYLAKYFSLEEGVCELTKDKLDYAGIADEDPLFISPTGTLEEVRNAAKDHDLIIIDSFQKLGAKPEEFDRLRQDFPDTVFIIIFQKTTGGNIRGGSMIKYDSAATINVTWQDGKRVAVMEKGRYGTQGWVYEIERDRVIFDGKQN